MILGTHAVVGSVIQYGFSLSPVWAFIAGFVSHFVLDAIPHQDYPILSTLLHPSKNNNLEIKSPIIKDILRMGFDCGLGFLVSFLFFSHGGTDFTFAYAAIGSVIPDALQVVYKFYPNILFHLQSFHSKIQKHTNWNTEKGIVYQTCMVMVLVSFAFLIHNYRF